MRVDVITYCPDLDLLRAELQWHYENDVGLKQYIETDGQGAYWMVGSKPHQEAVRYGVANDSVAVMHMSPESAYGLFDEEGVQTQGDIFDLVNINGTVIEPLAMGCLRDRYDTCPFTKLDTSAVTKVRSIVPETTITQDGEGDDVITHQPLKFHSIA